MGKLSQIDSMADYVLKTCGDVNPKLKAAIFIKNQTFVKDNKVDINEVAANSGYFTSLSDVNQFLMIKKALIKERMRHMSDDDLIRYTNDHTAILVKFKDIIESEDDKDTYKNILLHRGKEVER